jgi:hypothetical protein
MENLNDIDKQDQMHYENTPTENPFHLSVVTEATVITLQDHFEMMVNAVRNGELDALSLYTISKEVKDIADKVNREVQELAIEEAENRTEKSFKYGSKMITKVEGRRLIDFSDIEEWKIAKDNLKEIEDKYKQVALSKVSSLDESTGEVLQRPIITFSKSSIMVKNV